MTDSRCGSQFEEGDIVYFTVWADANCGPGDESEHSGEVADLDYQPNDEDRAEDTVGYLRAGRRYMLLLLDNGKEMIIAAGEVRPEPTSAYVPKGWRDDVSANTGSDSAGA